MPPCGGHPLVFETAPKVASFKSCPRVGGIVATDKDGKKHKGFKSCPRVGGIIQSSNEFRKLNVSSRAPVWGAS